MIHPPGVDPIVVLDLPEQGAIELPLAGIGSRGLAALVDLLWLLIPPLGCALAAWVIEPALMEDKVVQGFALALAMLLPILGPAVFELLGRGQSPGKRQVGIRVVSLDGRSVTANQVMVRNVLRFVDFLPLGYVFGVASSFVSGKGQRLGDVVAGTLVVREGRRALEEVRGIEVVPALGPEFHGIAAPLLRGVCLLLDPARQLPDEIREARQRELSQAIRACRRDLDGLGDRELWAWLEKGLRP